MKYREYCEYREYHGESDKGPDDPEKGLIEVESGKNNDCEHHRDIGLFRLVEPRTVQVVPDFCRKGGLFKEPRGLLYTP